MSDSLFRHEVLQAQRERRLGGIVLGQPLSLWLLSALAFAAAAVVLAFLVLGEYTRRTRVTGQLVPSLGVASVVAPASGTLAQVRVREGQRVTAGDVLAVVATPRGTLAGGDAALAVQRAIADRQGSAADSHASLRLQLQAQDAGLRARLDAARTELAQLRAELETREQQQALSLETLERYRRLRDGQFVTALQLQQQEALVLDQQAGVQAIARQLTGLQRQIAELQQLQREIPARLAAVDAAERSDRASLSQEAVEASVRAEAVILAPVTGTVGALMGQAGQAVQPGQPVLSLLPTDSRLEAHLVVPSRAVGFIAPGDTVRLRYQAFPYQKFGHHRGEVARISRSVLSAAELPSLPGQATSGEPFYRVVVVLDRSSVRAFGKDEPLRPGMLLDADILGEKRKLWEWLVEPLHALSGSLGNAD
jgi:membrane fusion protein